MIEIQNQEHFDKIKKFAEETGQMSELQKQLDYLDTYAENGERGSTRCLLGYDFAKHSFSFVMQKREFDKEYRDWFHGGLVYHGDGIFGSWSVHT